MKCEEEAIDIGQPETRGQQDGQVVGERGREDRIQEGHSKKRQSQGPSRAVLDLSGSNLPKIHVVSESDVDVNRDIAQFLHSAS